MKIFTAVSLGWILGTAGVHANLITSNAANGSGSVGNELLERATVDGSNGGVFLMIAQSSPAPFTSAAFPEEGVVGSWSFVGNQSTGGQYLTPFIVERFGIGPSYIVHGIGATRQTSGVLGPQTFAFDLQSGSDYVLDDGNYFFGWYDGRLDVSNVGANTGNGVIEFDSNTFSESGTVLYFGGAGYELISDSSPWNAGVNTDLTVRNQPTTLNRVYSVSASVIPEPGSIGLFVLGLGFLVSRRFFHAG